MADPMKENLLLAAMGAVASGALSPDAAEFLVHQLGGENPNVTADALGHRAQDQMIRWSELPIPCREEWALFTAMGIVFGEPVDQLLIRAQLPEGWVVTKTEHYIWSHLVDPLGRKRATIMYKPDFWDRDARISPERRFSAKLDCADGYNEQYQPRSLRYRWFVLDSGAVVWESEDLTFASHEERRGRTGGYMEPPLVNEGERFLDIHYPDWRHAGAYWS